MKKAIFIDLDGTLFNSQKQISETNVAALSKAEKCGFAPVICTGRSIKRVLSCNIPCIDYIIFNNGSGIYDCKAQEIIYSNPMRPESIRQVKSLAKKHKLELLVTELPNKGGIVQIIPLSDDYDFMRSVVIPEIKKIPYISIPNQSKKITDPNFEVDSTHDGGKAFCDINDENSSKGNGILKFAELFNIAKSDRIAIGDDLNDLSMFEACGYNVSMGNAIPVLKSRATYVTDTNDNDGVAKFIERLSKDAKV